MLSVIAARNAILVAEGEGILTRDETTGNADRGAAEAEESTSLTVMAESIVVVAFSVYAKGEAEVEVIVGGIPLLYTWAYIPPLLSISSLCCVCSSWP